MGEHLPAGRENLPDHAGRGESPAKARAVSIIDRVKAFTP